jgi:dynein heavy chain, axonemal
METEMNKLDQSAQLFEVQIIEFKQIKQCRKDVKLLKTLWDYVWIVRSSFEDWKQTKWREINSDSMDTECKKFAKELRGLDKEMRAWDAYGGVENDVKNMITSLRAVTELQNPAIRERHWQELMKATGVKFSMNEGTTFSDMLKLNLHKFEDEVSFNRKILTKVKK